MKIVINENYYNTKKRHIFEMRTFFGLILKEYIKFEEDWNNPIMSRSVWYVKKKGKWNPEREFVSTIPYGTMEVEVRLKYPDAEIVRIKKKSLPMLEVSGDVKENMKLKIAEAYSKAKEEREFKREYER